MQDGHPLVFAALYDTWESPEGIHGLKETLNYLYEQFSLHLIEACTYCFFCVRNT